MQVATAEERAKWLLLEFSCQIPLSGMAVKNNNEVAKNCALIALNIITEEVLLPLDAKEYWTNVIEEVIAAK